MQSLLSVVKYTALKLHRREMDTEHCIVSYKKDLVCLMSCLCIGPAPRLHPLKLAGHHALHHFVGNTAPSYCCWRLR